MATGVLACVLEFQKPRLRQRGANSRSDGLPCQIFSRRPISPIAPPEMSVDVSGALIDVPPKLIEHSARQVMNAEDVTFFA